VWNCCRWRQAGLHSYWLLLLLLHSAEGCSTPSVRLHVFYHECIIQLWVGGRLYAVGQRVEVGTAHCVDVFAVTCCVSYEWCALGRVCCAELKNVLLLCSFLPTYVLVPACGALQL
jgi:hypothetical protein